MNFLWHTLWTRRAQATDGAAAEAFQAETPHPNAGRHWVGEGEEQPVWVMRDDIARFKSSRGTGCDDFSSLLRVGVTV